MKIRCRVCDAELPSPVPERCPGCARWIERPFVDPALFRSLAAELVASGRARANGAGVVFVPSGATLRIDDDDPEDTRPDRRLSFARDGLPTVTLRRAPRDSGHLGFAGRIEVDTDVSDETLAVLFANAQLREHIVALVRGWDDVLRLHQGGLSLDSPMHEPDAFQASAVLADVERIVALGSELPSVEARASSSVRIARVISIVGFVAIAPAVVAFERHFASTQPVSWTAYGLMLPGPAIVAATLFAISRFVAGGELRFGFTGCLAVPFLFIAGAFGFFDAFVWANAALDSSRPVRADLVVRSAEVQTDADSDDETSFYAELTDPADPNALIQLRIQDPPFPATGRGVLSVAICPGAFGVRWYCGMPSR